MKTICQKNILAFIVLTFCFIFMSVLITGEAVADYWISGQVTAGAGPVSPSDRNKAPTPLTFYSDDMVAVGPSVFTTEGNRGEGHYYANLATGSLNASAYARDGYVPVTDPWGNLVRYDHVYGLGKAYVEMFETLHINIPSGSYSSDLHLTLSGLAKGTINTEHNGIAAGSFLAQITTSLGNAEAKWPASVYEGQASGDQTITVDMPFTLSAVILRAGDYSTVSNSDAYVSLSIGKDQILLASASSGNYPEISLASADFRDTLKITAIDVPPGVTWYSDSGVFLSELSTPVPEPATMLLLGSGLIGLAGYGRKKFFRK